MAFISRISLYYWYTKARGLSKRVPKVSSPIFLSLREGKQYKTTNFAASVGH